MPSNGYRARDAREPGSQGAREQGSWGAREPGGGGKGATFHDRCLHREPRANRGGFFTTITGGLRNASFGSSRITASTVRLRLTVEASIGSRPCIRYHFQISALNTQHPTPNTKRPTPNTKHQAPETVTPRSASRLPMRLSASYRSCRPPAPSSGGRRSGLRQGRMRMARTIRSRLSGAARLGDRIRR